MKLSEEEVGHIAKLARINLTDKEKADHGKKLSAILNYFEELKALNVDKVPSVGQITGLTNQLNEDEIGACLISREDLLKESPIVEKGYVKVKSVLGRET